MALRRDPVELVKRFADYAPGDRSEVTPFDPAAVRTAAVADVDAVAALSLARDGGQRDDVTRRIRAEIEGLGQRDAAWTVFVAEVDGEVVGYGRVRRLELEIDDPDMPVGWYLTGVIVADVHRRRGIGRALTEARIEWVAARADALYYFVNRANRASIDLHAALGFEFVGPVGYERARLTREEGRLYRLDLGGRAGV